MPVYSHRMMHDLSSSLISMSQTFFSRMPLILEPDEFLAAFVVPEHVAKLREVEELAGFIGVTSINSDVVGHEGTALKVEIGFGIRPPVILPRYVTGGLQSTCPEHVRERIAAWIDERLRFGRAFGDAYDALNHLNEVCADTRAMTIMLPCFPNIMGSISDDAEAKTTKRAQALAHSKSVGQLPRLPREVKERLQEVSAIVNSVALMKDAPTPEIPNQHARIVRSTYHASHADDRYNIFDADKPMQQARHATIL